MRMPGSLSQLQQGRGGLSTLAAAEPARQVVDEDDWRMPQRGEIDIPPGLAARALDLEPRIATVDRWSTVGDESTGSPSLILSFHDSHRSRSAA